MLYNRGQFLNNEGDIGPNSCYYLRLYTLHNPKVVTNAITKRLVIEA